MILFRKPIYFVKTSNCRVIISPTISVNIKPQFILELFTVKFILIRICKPVLTLLNTNFHNQKKNVPLSTTFQFKCSIFQIEKEYYFLVLLKYALNILVTPLIGNAFIIATIDLVTFWALEGNIIIIDKTTTQKTNNDWKLFILMLF